MIIHDEMKVNELRINPDTGKRYIDRYTVNATLDMQEDNSVTVVRVSTSWGGWYTHEVKHFDHMAQLVLSTMGLAEAPLAY